MPLIGIALLLIAALVLLFLRSLTDLLFTFTGLVLSLIWLAASKVGSVRVGWR